MRTIVLAGMVGILTGASTASAQIAIRPQLLPPLVTVPVPLVIQGNQAQGTIALPGGIGAQLTITFENVEGLTPTALQASASLVNPLDPTLLSRLPDLLSVPTAFPVVVRVTPSPSSTLVFSGIYTLSFHTSNLSLDLLHPLSLVKSPNGGAFRDITKSEGIGSYRDDGSGGDFSDFLIALDLRPIDAVISGKFDDLQTLLDDDDASMPPAVGAALQALLSQARAFYEAGDLPDAVDEMQAFSDYVKAHSGAEIPDVWQAQSPSVVNVAGRLRAAADSLRFSLDRKASL